jgi:hypothetical protein
MFRPGDVSVRLALEHFKMNILVQIGLNGHEITFLPFFNTFQFLNVDKGNMSL